MEIQRTSYRDRKLFLVVCPWCAVSLDSLNTEHRGMKDIKTPAVHEIAACQIGRVLLVLKIAPFTFYHQSGATQQQHVKVSSGPILL